MAKTTDQITVDPQGQSMVVDVFDSNGVSVTCYTARAGSSAFTLPVTISTATTFYLTSGGYYSVSAKVAGVEIAGVAGQRASVQAAQSVPVTVTPVIDAREALAALGSGSAASGPSWVEHDLSLLAADGIVGGADTATWADAAGPIVRQTLDVGTGSLDWLAGLPSTEFVIQYDVRIPSGQDAGTIVTAAFQVAESVTADTAAENVGLGVGLVAVSAGDTTDYALGAFVDGTPNDGNGAPVTIPADEWHTIRGVVSFSVQMFYLDGVYKGINMLSSGGNAYSGGHNGPDAVGLVATGLVDFRNLKVWTRVLPA